MVHPILSNFVNIHGMSLTNTTKIKKRVFDDIISNLFMWPKKWSELPHLQNQSSGIL